MVIHIVGKIFYICIYIWQTTFALFCVLVLYWIKYNFDNNSESDNVSFSKRHQVATTCCNRLIQRRQKTHYCYQIQNKCAEYKYNRVRYFSRTFYEILDIRSLLKQAPLIQGVARPVIRNNATSLVLIIRSEYSWR